MDKLDYYTEDPVGIWNKKDDCHSGNYTFHFWSTYKHHFKLEQTISKKKLKKNKTYKASVYIQGDEVGADAEIYLYDIRWKEVCFWNGRIGWMAGLEETHH